MNFFFQSEPAVNITIFLSCLSDCSSILKMTSALFTVPFINPVTNAPFYPVDTGRKLSVHKTFRRRLGRLLNVLRTFNLRPVSTGIKCKTMLSGNNKNEQVTPGNKNFSASACYCSRFSNPNLLPNHSIVLKQ